MTTPDKSVAWYKEEIGEIPASGQDLLDRYSSIPAEDLAQHLFTEVRPPSSLSPHHPSLISASTPFLTPSPTYRFTARQSLEHRPLPLHRLLAIPQTQHIPEPHLRRNPRPSPRKGPATSGPWLLCRSRHPQTRSRWRPRGTYLWA